MPTRADDDGSRAARLELDVDVRQRQRMTQRNQIGRPLRGHDAGEPRGLQRVAFLDARAPNRADRRRAHPDRRRRRPPHARVSGFADDVDHAHAAAGVDVRERAAARG